MPCLGFFGHDFSNSNSDYFTTKYAMMALVQNKDFNVKYVYHEEFHNEIMKPIMININESSIYDFVTDHNFRPKAVMLSCIQYEKK